jgi:predicted ATPase
MLLKSITLRNLPSFKDTVLDKVRPLNVLIGPNGSGKTNFIEAISLLQAAPVELNRAIRGRGRRPRVDLEGCAGRVVGCQARVPGHARNFQRLLTILAKKLG